MKRIRSDGVGILVLGDINADVMGRVKSWPEPGEECLAERLELHCGGVGANCALALRRWGVSVRLLGCVGKDEFGRLLLKTLSGSGVDVQCVRQADEAMTGLLYINVTPDGQRTFFGSRGANQFVRRLGRGTSTQWKRARAAIVMGYSFLDAGGDAAAKQIITAVHGNGGWVSLDAGMEPSKKIPRKILQVAKWVDLLFVSSEEATALTGIREPDKAFQRFLDAGVREIVMKLGKHGCLVAEGGTLRHVPSFSVRSVDSTGAGDAFTAAFLQARLRKWHVAEAAVAANAAGAAAAGVLGAGERLPTLGQIVRVLRTQHLNKPWDAIRLNVLQRLSGGSDAAR
jgi:ribokinase